MLEPCGLSLSAAQHVLATEIAGPPAQPAPLLYDADAVAQLAARPLIDTSEVARVCPTGYLVARLPRQRRFLVGSPWSDQSARLEGPWRMDAMVHLVVAVLVSRESGFPLILLASGFVVAGAEVTGLRGSTLAEQRFDVEPAGAWFDRFRGRRCAAGRGRQTELRGWAAAAPVRRSARIGPLQE